MAEDILLRYRAETDQLTKELNLVIEQQEKLQKEVDDTNKSTQKSISVETTAAKAREQLIAKELSNIEKLRAARARVSDPKMIEKFNSAIARSEANIRTLGTATAKTANQIRTTLNSAGSQIATIGQNIAAGFIAAFSVQQAIAFGRAAVDAFIEAEENANRLKFAITEVNNETEATFDRLIKQSSELQAISIFSDDDIQRAQTALATFGLTGDQIEALIPKILDLASANKIDLATATDAAIRAFEGQTRGLVTLGVKFDDTGSRLGNYNKLMEETAKFTGATEEATTTLSGSLEQAKNQVGELEEEIGEGLAPTFVNLRKSFLELTKTILEGMGLIKTATAESLQAENQAEIILAEVEGQVEFLVNSGLAVDEAREKVLKRLLDRTRTELARALDLSGNERQVARLNNELTVLSEQLTKLNKQRADNARILREEQLQNKTVEELNNLLKEQTVINDTIAKDNIDLINKELEARKKAAIEGQKATEQAAQKEAEARQKAYEKMIKDATAFQKILEETSEISLKFEFENILASEGPVAAIDFLKQQLSLKLQDTLDELQNEINTNPLNIGLTDAEKNALALKEFQDFTKKINEAFKTAGIEIDATSEDITAVIGEDFLSLPFDQALSVLLTASRRYFPAFVTQSQEATNEATDHIKDYADTWLSKNEQILRSSTELFAQLTELSNRLTDTTIENLEKQLQANNETAQKEQDALDQSRDKRLISESEYRKKSDAIEAKRIENEKKVQAEINKIKKRQAVLNKANALFEISLNTAIAITQALSQGNVVLAALVAALGAAQAATVAATPIPAFKKGTKGKKGSGMALVGEEGPEITFIPNGAKILPAKQTKTYAEVFDAMYDNKFDKYVLSNFVAPALLEQKRKFEEKQQASFASNVVNSMQVHGLTTGDLMYGLRKGTKINNAQELAELIGKAISNNQQTPNLWRR